MSQRVKAHELRKKDDSGLKEELIKFRVRNLPTFITFHASHS